jgi:hypothetical protein
MAGRRVGPGGQFSPQPISDGEERLDDQMRKIMDDVNGPRRVMPSAVRYARSRSLGQVALTRVVSISGRVPAFPESSQPIILAGQAVGRQDRSAGTGQRRRRPRKLSLRGRSVRWTGVVLPGIRVLGGAAGADYEWRRDFGPGCRVGAAGCPEPAR